MVEINFPKLDAREEHFRNLQPSQWLIAIPALFAAAPRNGTAGLRGLGALDRLERVAVRTVGLSNDRG